MSHLVLDIETVALEQTDTFAPASLWRIVTIGILDRDRFGVIEGETEEQKVAALVAYLERTKPDLVTFNGRGFDVPVIVARALRYGIPMPWWYGDRSTRYRYSEHGHWDLADWLSDYGAGRFGSLHHAARLVGMPGKVGVSGGDVASLSQAEVDAYCMTDVAQTAALALRCMLLRGTLAREQYRDAAARLVARIEANPATKVVAEHMDRNVFLLKDGT